MAETKKPTTEYEGPEIFEIGNVEELTFGPTANQVPDAATIQHQTPPTPC